MECCRKKVVHLYFIRILKNWWGLCSFTLNWRL